MPPKRKPNSTFPPLEQEALFEHLKNRIGLCKYIDFLKVIRECHEKEKIQDTKKVRAIYTPHLSSLIMCYTKEERVLANNGNNIKEALEKTDLKSEFLINHLKTYLDDADAEGAYYNSAILNTGQQPPAYSGMTNQDSEVLNRDYILTSNIRSCNTRGKQSKEHRENDKNDQNLQIAENNLHEMQVRLKRCLQLQGRVQWVVRNGQAIQGCSSKRKQNESVEFSAVDVAELAQMLKKGKRATEKEIKAEARKMLESLRKDPVHKGPSLLEQIESHRDQLCQGEKAARLGYRMTMNRGYYNSIVRDTKTIKFRQYPSVTFDSLLDEILDLEAGRRPNPTSFSGRDDDVGRNLTYDGGLLMQFETSRWHSEAFNLMFNTRYTAQLQPKIEQFKRVMLSFFDLALSERGTTRGHAGDFSGVVLYGDELLYTTFRLYHTLITRLHTAFLLAEVAVADTNFRNHTNEIGKPRMEGSEWDGYVSDSLAEEGGWTPKPLPTVEGNAQGKMNACLKAIGRKALANRKHDYSLQNFEMDVIAAVGPEGNQLFTITRILDRIRDTIREMKWEQLDDFERYLQEVKSGNRNAAADYLGEVSGYEHGWLFKLQCIYADSFKNDEFGSVGEQGDVGRVKVTIEKRGTVPEKKDLKRSIAAGSGTRGRKRRKKHFG